MGEDETSGVAFGLKVDSGRLDEAEWTDRFGRAETFLSHLPARGFQFVELSWGEELPLGLLERIGRLAADAGLGCSVHPYLHAGLAPEAFTRREAGPGLDALLAVAQRLAGATGGPVTMNFHGGVARHEPHHVSREDATAAGRRFFRYVGERCAERFPSVRPFAETQVPHDAADRGLVRLGDRWGDLLRLIEDAEVGICWDWGHSFISAHLGKHAVFPPGEALRRVGHVHAHDTVPDGSGGLSDHRPLGTGVCPWRAFAERLAERGFAGRIVFEHDPLGLGWQGPEDLAAALRPGMDELRRIFTGGGPEGHTS